MTDATNLSKTKLITAQDQFTDTLELPNNREYNVTALVTGATFVFTPTIQFRAVGETLWTDVVTNNFPALSNAGDERHGVFVGPIEMRVGVKTGEFTSSTDGTCTIQGA